MNIYEAVGPAAIGSRLRLLSEQIAREGRAVYGLYGLDLKPKWFPVLAALSLQDGRTVTGLAQEIRQTHPSVSAIVRELSAAGLVRTEAGASDARQSVVFFTQEGRKAADKLAQQMRDVAQAIEDIRSECCADLWKAVGEWEERLAEKSLLARVEEVRRRRASQKKQAEPRI